MPIKAPISKKIMIAGMARVTPLTIEFSISAQPKPQRQAIKAAIATPNSIGI